jgi:hypothetical protein
MQDILDSVRKYIDETQANKTWTAGKDFVPYAGAYYNSEEYVAGIESLLKGWLVMGQAGIRFEHEFPKQYGKQYGVAVIY